MSTNNQVRVNNVPGNAVDSPVHPLLVKLEQCHGTEQYWRHSFFRKLLYTDGMRLLFDEGKCWWLSDIIGSIFNHKDVRDVERMRVHIRRKDTKGSVTVYDLETDKIVYQQELPYTTFPFEDFLFCMSAIMFPTANDGPEQKHHLLFLPSED